MHDVLLVGQCLYRALAGVISDFLESLVHPLPLLVAACIAATILLPQNVVVICVQSLETFLTPWLHPRLCFLGYETWGCLRLVKVGLGAWLCTSTIIISIEDWVVSFPEGISVRTIMACWLLVRAMSRRGVWTSTNGRLAPNRRL